MTCANYKFDFNAAFHWHVNDLNAIVIKYNAIQIKDCSDIKKINSSRYT